MSNNKAKIAVQIPELHSTKSQKQTEEIIWKHSSSLVCKRGDYIYCARINELDNETFDWTLEVRFCSHNPESIRTVDVFTGNQPYLNEAKYDVELFIKGYYERVPNNANFYGEVIDEYDTYPR